MTFTYPWVLLLLAVPALLLWSVPYRGAGLVLPFDHQSHRRRRGLHWLLTGFDCAPAVLLAPAIVMLAVLPLTAPSVKPSTYSTLTRAARSSKRECR